MSNTNLGVELDRLRAENKALRAERDRLQAFKTWVHTYLDTHCVPHHPPGTHGEHGCRIGDRMDWVMAKLAKSEAERDLTVDHY